MADTQAPVRRPKPGETLLVYGERLTIYRITDRGRGPLAVVEDDAGWRIERPCDRLRWVERDGAWVA